MAAIETKDLYPKYFNLFKRYGYSGNGESWSDIIQQILEKRAPDLIERITFDPEAGAFFAYAKNEGDRQRFIQIVAPVFSDIKALESFIRNADKSRMDD